MGQVVVAPLPPSLILTSLDRLVASNADGGLSPLASHLVLLGEDAGQNLGDIDYIYVIGAFALDAGTSDAGLTGSVIMGGLNATALTNLFPPPLNHGPLVMLGYNNFPTKVNTLGSSVVIGNNIAENFQANNDEVSSAVIIGHDALRNQYSDGPGGLGYRNSIFIGARVMRGPLGGAAGNHARASNSVIIGVEALLNAGTVGNGSAASSCVVIGAQAGRDAASINSSSWANTVAIGPVAFGNVPNASDCVVIGAGITGAIGAAGQDSMTLIGAAISGSYVAGSSGNTALGFGVSFSGVGSGNILIGANCNGTADLPAAAAHRLVFETGVGAVRRNVLYGLMSNGATPCGLAVGFSVAANRDLPGVNVLKLIDGSWNGVNPAGGGLFYGNAGLVHWVSPAGLDYDLTNGGSLGNFAVAALPAAPPQGSKAFATDALAPVFATAVAAGGAVYTPVYFDGAAWLCG